MVNKKSIDDYYAVWKDLTENPPPSPSGEEAVIARERHFDLLQAVLHHELRNPECNRTFAQLQALLAMTLTPKLVRCLERTDPTIKDYFERLILTWRRETNRDETIRLVHGQMPTNVVQLAQPKAANDEAAPS
jgi:hypothetical protein